MYIIDFQRASYYQKCHDPDCKGRWVVCLVLIFILLAIPIYSSSAKTPVNSMISLGYRSPLRPLPWDVIPDCSTFNSALAENYMEVLNGSIVLQPCEINKDYHSCEDWLTESCEDSGWWQEAIRYAECIESMRNAPHVSNLVHWRLSCHLCLTDIRFC